MTTPNGQDPRVARFEQMLRSVRPREPLENQPPIPNYDAADEVVAILEQEAGRHKLTEETVTAMNQCPTDEVLAVLLRLTDPANRRVFDPAAADERYFEEKFLESRGFDALLRLNGFDRVAFLSSRLETDTHVGWCAAYVRELGRLRDARVVPGLCRILLTHRDSDVRFAAAGRLGKLGDPSALDALDHAAAHDLGQDYEGWPVAGEAWTAAQRLRGEPGPRRPVGEWMAEMPPLPLRDLVAGLEALGNHLTIYIAQDEMPTASSLLTLSPPTRHRDVLYDEYNLCFFDEVVRVKTFLNRWRTDREGQPVTLDEASAALIRGVRQRHVHNDTPFPGDEALAAGDEDAPDAR